MVKLHYRPTTNNRTHRLPIPRTLRLTFTEPGNHAMTIRYVSVVEFTDTGTGGCVTGAYQNELCLEKMKFLPKI